MKNTGKDRAGQSNDENVVDLVGFLNPNSTASVVTISNIESSL